MWEFRRTVRCRRSKEDIPALAQAAFDDVFRTGGGREASLADIVELYHIAGNLRRMALRLSASHMV